MQQNDESGSLSREQSHRAFEQARRVMPGGVNSPARSYASVDGPPPFIERADGAWVVDVDDNRYLDFVGSWGPMILGHNPDSVRQALEDQIDDGVSYGAPTPVETRMAELVRDLVPSIEVVRMVNSGTEATMSALRLARGFTGRDLVVKFRGCYHGHGDSLLVQAGSGGATLGQPDSAGVPEDVARLTLTLPFGDVEAVRRAFEEHGDDIAGVILEPVAGNMGLIEPPEAFLVALREQTRSHESVLIFDEVMTGFRVALGGAQERLGMTPDLTTLGKIIGGGLPVGAYGGTESIMREVAPDGPVYQAGTLSGNPLAMRAGLETLRQLKSDPPYEPLEEGVDRIERAFRRGSETAGVPLQFHRMGGMFSYYFTDETVVDYETASAVDDELFARFHNLLLENGLYCPPSYYESCFIGTAHLEDELLSRATDGIRRAFESL